MSTFCPFARDRGPAGLTILEPISTKWSRKRSQKVVQPAGISELIGKLGENGAVLSPERSLLRQNFADNRGINREFARLSSERFSIIPVFLGDFNDL